MSDEHVRGEAGLLQAVLDAMPSMVFLVDDDMRILEFNAAAANLMSQDRLTALLRQRAGDGLHCLNSLATSEGCGHSTNCRSCVLRNSVNEAATGQRIVRRRTRMELTLQGHRQEIYALVTASPFTFASRSRILLVIEDISELAEIQHLIPICCVCKKIRNDSASWMKIESYFKSYWDVDFSHGYCPDCHCAEKARLLSEHESFGRDPGDSPSTTA